MAFIEMLSDAALLEMLMIEVLRGNVPQSQPRESAEKSNTSFMQQNEARFQVSSPFQLLLRISMELQLKYFEYLHPSFIMRFYLQCDQAASHCFNI